MKKSLRRGATLVEVVTAAGMSVLVIGSAIAALLAGMRTWAQGESYIGAEIEGQQAVKRIAQEIREAVRVTVSTDGRRIDYEVPRRAANGDFVVPPQSDGVQRSVQIISNPSGRYTLYIGPTASLRPITDFVILTDPGSNNNSAYRPFRAGQGQVIRQVDIQLVTETASLGPQSIYHRVREKVFLRNIPTTTR